MIQDIAIFWPILVCQVPAISRVLRQIQCHIHYWHRLLVWHLWSLRRVGSDPVACCITSSIDMSGLPVYGRGFLSWHLDLTSFYLSKLYVRWSLSLFWDSYFRRPRIHFVLCVISLHFSSSCWYVFPLDSASGSVSGAFSLWNKQTASIVQIRLYVFHEFNSLPCLFYPLLLRYPYHTRSRHQDLLYPPRRA